MDEHTISKRELLKRGTSTLIAGSTFTAATGSVQAEHGHGEEEGYKYEYEVISQCAHYDQDSNPKRAIVEIVVDTPLVNMSTTAVNSIIGYGIGSIISSGVGTFVAYLGANIGEMDQLSAQIVLKEDENGTTHAGIMAGEAFGTRTVKYVGSVYGHQLNLDYCRQCEDTIVAVDHFLA